MKEGYKPYKQSARRMSLEVTFKVKEEKSRYRWLQASSDRLFTSNGYQTLSKLRRMVS